jgi:hypothetical protein
LAPSLTLPLAGAVGADDADPVAALDADGEIRHYRRCAIAFRDALGFDHQRARPFRLGGGHGDGAGRAPGVAAALAQRLQFGDSAHVALAPRGDAVAHPVLFGGDLAVELVQIAFFLGQDLVAPRFERSKSALGAARFAAVEQDRDPGQVGQKAAVVADEDEGAPAGGQFGFEPFDGRQIQVVGGFVQEQDIGRRRQHAHQGGAARLAARQRRRILVAAQSDLLQQVARRVAVVIGAEAGLHVTRHVGKAGKIRLLRQVADGGVRLAEDRAAVRLDQSGRDPQQRRLARAVAADKAHALARRHHQIDACKQRRTAEGQRNAGELEEGGGHVNVDPLAWRGS